MTRELPTTGVERFFGKDEIIVSKTDLKGRITYATDLNGLTGADIVIEAIVEDLDVKLDLFGKLRDDKYYRAFNIFNCDVG